jgi:hypothetical protein
MSNEQWFYQLMGETNGPVTEESLRLHALPDSLVRRTHEEDWHPLGELEDASKKKRSRKSSTQRRQESMSRRRQESRQGQREREERRRYESEGPVETDITDNIDD